MSNISETLNLKGRLSIVKKFNNGLEELIFEENNIIVNTGKQLVLSQLFYSSGSGNPLSYAKIGVGGALDMGGLILKTPTASQTDLYTSSFTIPISKTAEDAGVPSITLSGVVDNSTGNGLNLNEAGFFTAGGTMFNIKTFPFVSKNSSFSLNLVWVIRF
jgi:hypothetical protein